MANKVIFWDFDGTLSRANKAFATALYSALSQLGHRVDSSAAMVFFENVYPWKTPMADHSTEIGEQWWNTFFQKIDGFCRDAGIAEADLGQIHVKCRQILIDIRNYSLYDDTLSTLEACRSLGYRNYLLTNNYPEILENVKKLGLSPYFTDYIVSSHVGYDKPRKEIFDYAKMLANDPNICYMIGDNPIADIRGANGAGIQTIYVHNGPLPYADLWADRLEDIPALLV